MLTEDYCDFETAKLLKEKGFDEPTTKSYYTEGFENPMKFSHDLLPCIRPDEFLCPTLQMAMKWLREVHGLFIEVHIVEHSTAYMDNKYYFYKLYKNRRPLRFVENTFLTYEEACEAAIKYCLENLI